MMKTNIEMAKNKGKNLEEWNSRMGNCVGRDSLGIPRQTLEKMSKLLSRREISILRLIYSDLAERIEKGKINLENFLLFFHKNGYWGERLFQEFDYDETNLLSEDQFIHGISKIFKSSETEKINLLFKFFSQGHSNGGGICFHDFLTMLYNYPKEDLNQILNDKQFIEKELRNHLLPVVDNAEEGVAYYSLESSTNIRQYLPPSLENLDERLNRKFSHFSKTTERADSDQFPSMLGRELAKTIQSKRKISDSLIKLNYDNKVLNIKALNIQQLVKMFALMIFRQASIDIRTGKLGFQQFYRWIRQHKALYKNYYYGFHNEIWEVDSSSHKPKYLSMACEKSSEAQTIVQKELLNIKLYFHNSILVACRTNNLEEPLMVICLEGLAVRRIFQIENGFGIEVSHRDGVYKDKRFFFKNQEMLLSWMVLLNFYKGYTVQTRYEVGEKIGRGKFSVVYRCEALEDGQEFALKEIATYKLENEAKLLIAHESSIMQVVSHPFLLKFKECIQTKTHLYIITQLVKGVNLFDLVKQKGYLKEQEAAKICQQMIVGARFLHSFDIVHRDLKPENIMVVMDEQTKEIESIKIIDFGFSNYLSKIHSSKGDYDMAGTPNYIAPEVLKEEPFDFKIDNFAIGVILFFMLMGSLPFYDTDITQTLTNTINGDYQFGDRVIISSKAKDLIEQLLKNDPKERISLDRALEHEWFHILSQHD